MRKVKRIVTVNGHDHGFVIIRKLQRGQFLDVVPLTWSEEDCAGWIRLADHADRLGVNRAQDDGSRLVLRLIDEFKGEAPGSLAVMAGDLTPNGIELVRLCFWIAGERLEMMYVHNPIH